MSLVLTVSGEKLEITATTVIPFTVHYADYVGAAPSFTPGVAAGDTINGTKDLLVAPGSGQRVVRTISVHNDSGGVDTITIQLDVAGVNYTIVTVALPDECQLYYDEDGWKVINASGEAAMVMNAHGFLDGAAHIGTATQVPTRGSLVFGDATPEWNELTIGAAGAALYSDGTDVSWTLTPTWLGVHTHAFNIDMDDGVGDSPAVRFIGGSNNDTALIYLDNDMVAGRSDLAIQLCDNAGQSRLYLYNLNGNPVFWVTSEGDFFLIDDAFFGCGPASCRFVFDVTPAPDQILVEDADFHLQGNKIIIDNTDDDTYLISPGDDQIDLYIGGALDFSWAANSFNVLAGSGITMADDTWIGIGAALERIIFDAAGDICVMGADFGVGTVRDEVEGSVIAGAMTGNLVLFKAGGYENFALLDSRSALHQGPNFGFGITNDAGQAVRIGLFTCRPSSVADGAESGYFDIYTKPAAAAVALVMHIDKDGIVTIPDLAGAGNRPVIADVNGVLSAP